MGAFVDANDKVMSKECVVIRVDKLTTVCKTRLTSDQVTTNPRVLSSNPELLEANSRLEPASDQPYPFVHSTIPALWAGP
jgi:hypothetical protein